MEAVLMRIGPPQMASTVRNFSFSGFQVTNEAATSTSADGMVAAGAPVTTATIGHMFPASGETIARLELQSPGNVQMLHTPSPDLRAVVQGSQLRASIVTFGGKTYEVKTLGKWLDGPAGTESWHVAVIQEVTRS